MEKKIGEVFEHQGVNVKVVATEFNNCGNCCFLEENAPCSRIRTIAGECLSRKRTDKKSVIFVEVKNEQPQEQAEQPLELNLCEVLKYCPQGETFWSPMLDGVKFSCIDEERQMIIVETVEGHFTWEINHDGTISIDEVTSPEVMLYPSKEQRDWTKVKYEKKKEKFDPKTLKTFDKILIYSCGRWEGSFFNRLLIQSTGKIGRVLTSCGSSETYCVPYNDDTKHLLGTKDEAPEFYRYWED